MQNFNCRRRIRVARFVLIATVFAVALTGCSSDEEAETESNPVKVTPAKTETPAATPAVTESQPNNDKPVEFIAPYSDDRDPFAIKRPKQVKQPIAPPPTTAESGPDGPPPVRLVGFVKVKEPKALLSIDGATARVLKVGDEVDGVKLMGISGNAVSLAFGGHQWEAKLLDKKPKQGPKARAKAKVGSAPSKSPTPATAAVSIPDLPSLPGTVKKSGETEIAPNLDGPPGNLERTPFGSVKPTP